MDRYPFTLIQNQQLVSVITPSYNSQDFIRHAYASLKNQTYANWEWLVTDDCSSDSTFEILRDISALDPRVRVFKNKENRGAAFSRNSSISKAAGTYVAFLDADDSWLPNKLEAQVDFMLAGINFSFTSYFVINEKGERSGKVIDNKNRGPYSYSDMLMKRATLGCSTVMLKRSAFENILMPDMRTGQDYALWLKLLRTGQKAYLLDCPLTQYRITPGSISRNKLKKAARQWTIYRNIEKLSVPKSFFCFTFYAFRAVFR